jgi:hypothetical protein
LREAEIEEENDCGDDNDEEKEGIMRSASSDLKINQTINWIYFLYKPIWVLEIDIEI